ncbi:GtrA family protein [Nocardioides sp. zg-DK7169]|uniref:GtrA family protein n=1 Tax=Nocardioides sp. zg-DK7169 TaxID=2736600 RepID=UPI00155204B5|nr:GtrA family protein [Nocardioides sp. zg-DK7169]
MRFAAVGVVNTAIDVVLFTLLHPHLGIVAANLISTSAGMLFSFTVNGLLVFDAGRLRWRDAARFVATTGVSMWVLQPVLIHLLIDHAPAPVAKLMATAITVVVNFVAYRYLVWPARARA